jgi:serine/threonine protein kinase
MHLCLTRELVERYIKGLFTDDEKRTIEDHLVECENCRQLLESTRSGMANTEPSDSSNTGETATQARPQNVPSHQDEKPTKSISQFTSVPLARDDFTKSIESMVEGYKILQELPRGGQAIVFKAIHLATKTTVAIKVLLPTLLASTRARYYFERETELIASLDHPNIVSIRDSGIIHGQYYFVMQYVEGQPLSRYARIHELSFRERVVLFSKICSAVSYAHRQGVIHRDLKFANIIVDERGEPHILDFGLAKAIGLSEKTRRDSAVVTMSGQWSGSLSTMSPEQAAGEPNLIDVRTDVYSLGVTLYHMLTGQYPYNVMGSTLSALQNIQTAEPVRPRHIIRKFDSDIEAILLTALAKDPAHRYQSAAELQGDIENWMHGRPIRVRSVSTLYLLRKIITRHRYTSTVAALLLLIILGFAYVSFELYVSAKKARRESDKIAQQWATQAGAHLSTVRQMAFTFFLQAWHEGREKEATSIVKLLSKGSKERKAAEFLLNQEALDKKEPEFRRYFSGELAWFADFIVGEHYLKKGDKQKARGFYSRSFQSIRQLSRDEPSRVDGWLSTRILARLDELNTNSNGDNK